MAGRIKVSLLCSSLLALTFLTSCKTTSPKPPASNASTPQTEPSAQPSVEPTQAQSESPPTTAELRAVIERIYKDAVTIDESQPEPSVVGDFNGDGSQDIAIIIKPATGKLSQLNDEYANWILEDPRHIPQLDPNKSVQAAPPKPAPVKIQQHDVLLTIIHGYQQSGWRNPEARQTYLLKNAVGKDLKVEPAREAIRSAQSPAPVTAVGSDVIRQTLAGESGFIFWGGAKYVWQKSVETDAK
jgi:hypothetical protein